MTGLSMYAIVEASRHKLKLRGRSVGLWLLAAFLVVCGLPLLYFAVFELGRRHTILRVAGGSLGLFFIVCGLAVVRLAWGYAAGIEFDGLTRVARFTGTRSPAMEIPFDEIAAVEVTVSKSPGGRRDRPPEHRVVLKLAGGDEIVVDRSTNAGAMESLAARALGVVRSSGSVPAEIRTDSAIAGAPPGSTEAPDGIEIVKDGPATVYGWRTLPPSLFWVWFFGFVTTLFAALTLGAAIGTAAELMKESLVSAVLVMGFVAAVLGLGYLLSRARRRGLLWISGAAVVVQLANLILGLKPYVTLMGLSVLFGLLCGLSAFILFGRCTVRTTSARFQYEERIGGIPLTWRWASVPAEQIVAFHIRDQFSGGGAIRVVTEKDGSFHLMIPQGLGSFSRRDLEWLRGRWLRELGVAVP